MTLETLTTVHRRLIEQGYSESFKVDGDELRALEADRAVAPDEDLEGTWVAAFGPIMEPGAAEMARRPEEGLDRA